MPGSDPTPWRAAEGCIEVLVAEDEPAFRELIGAIFDLAEWDEPTRVANGAEALQLLKERRWDILIADLNMPRMSGESLIREALSLQPELTVLVITGCGTLERAVSLMKQGVFDFLTKPFTVEEFVASLSRARERALSMVTPPTPMAVVESLLVALGSKDAYLDGHSNRVACYAEELGQRLGLEKQELFYVREAGKLHDVGKIGIREELLTRAGPLNAEEFEEMKRHPVISREIVGPVQELARCLPGVYHHHERWDGEGYPEGLGGEEIPLAARIIAVADAYDAMTNHRSYRRARSVEVVERIIREAAGTQFDREIALAFLDSLPVVIGVGDEVVR
ncbi:MAG: HD domain-containing phosphohydrolase [Planctomycetota bacterium]